MASRAGRGGLAARRPRPDTSAHPGPLFETLSMHRLPSLILAVATLSTTVTLAQNDAPNPRQACRSSALEFCRHEAMSRDAPGVRACLIKNFDKLTPECQAAMKAMAAKLPAEAAPDAPPPKP